MKHEVITAVSESDRVEHGAGQLLTRLKSSVADIFVEWKYWTPIVVIVMNKNFVNLDRALVSLTFL